MRRSLKLVLSLILLLGVFPAEVSSAAALYGGVYRSADASWIVKQKGDYFMYFAAATHFTNADHSHTRAVVDRSKCFHASNKHMSFIACSLTLRTRRIEPDRFVFDPLLGSASLRWKGNRVYWVAEGLPWPGVSPGAGAYGAYGFAEVDQWAIASGTVLDRKLRGSSDDFAGLYEGAYAFVDTGARHEIRHYADGRIKVEMEFRIPK